MSECLFVHSMEDEVFEAEIIPIENGFALNITLAATIAVSVASIPVTLAPSRAIGSASKPPPQPISKIFSPANDVIVLCGVTV